MGWQRWAVVAASVTALVMVGAPAHAAGGEVGGSGRSYHLTDGWNARTDRVLAYGRPEDRVYVGDWNGDGRDTLAVRRGATYYFSNTLSGGAASRVVTYGRAADTVLMGDWDGDGVDTPVVRRGNVYHFKNDLNGGRADRVIAYGRAGDQVLVGDWDGDGRDTLGVRRGAAYHLKNTLDGGRADHVVAYGRAGDVTLVGDWDGDGTDTLGVRRGSAYYLKNRIAGGPADRVLAFGRAGDAVMVGDWNGDGAATLGIRRPAEPAGSPARPGFPNASNTGVPAGTSLSTYTGPCTITTPNTVIDAKTVNCGLRIQAANVTISRSVVNGPVATSGRSASFTLSDSEVRLGRGTVTGVGDSNFTVRRTEVTGGNRSANCAVNCVIEDSYFHGQDIPLQGDVHASGVRMGANGVIRHNTIACDVPNTPGGGGCSASLTGYGDFAPVENMTIDNNLIAASTGGYCAYGGSSKGKPFSGDANNVVFTNNVFERGEGGKCGFWGPIADFDPSRPGNVWSGNVWDDGSPLRIR